MTDDYTLIPLDDTAELTAPDAPTDPPARRLNPIEQLQVAIWVVEGLKNDKIHALMRDCGMPAVGHSALTRYRHDENLLEAAKKYLRREIMTVALAEKAVRVRQLQRHADRLAQLMDEMGLVERTTKITGYDRSGGGPMTTEEEKFAASLSKEWRDTLKQIRDEVEPIEALLVPTHQTNNTTVIFNALSEADQEQFRQAMAWMPAVMPRPLLELTASPVEEE
jgi:hypothetical protein